MRSLFVMVACSVVAVACTSSAKDAVDAGSASDAAIDSPSVDAGADAEVDATDAADASEEPACALSVTVESPACTSCLAASCCAETSACMGDAACAAVDACVNQCVTTGGGDAGDIATCAQTCANDAAPAVREAYKTWSACLSKSCDPGGAGPCN